ncbi:sulfate reduction electron transfer complex DsrMKJOP subunit DsrM [Candidatus Hydrogenedentota bacterium]
MAAIISLIAVLVLALLAWMGGSIPGGAPIFTVVIPYLAMIVFIVGVATKILKWARTPVPFRIAGTFGQANSLDWIKNDNLDCAHTTLGVIARMALETLCFRSLFRNTATRVEEGPKVIQVASPCLWAAAMAFHWSFLTVALRHLRFFTDPTPFFVIWIERLDGFLELGVPTVFMSSLVLFGALGFLLFRRFAQSSVRYISLPSDYFTLYLLLGIAGTGILMRHTGARVDVTAIKELAVGLASFHPVVPGSLGGVFYVHIFLVSVLLAFFPFSKLMHAPGVFLSPTRNLANNSRMKRHVNPWDYPVAVHTYEEYEDEFREKMKKTNIPVDKE